jgi:hypothetical protein
MKKVTHSFAITANETYLFEDITNKLKKIGYRVSNPHYLRLYPAKNIMLVSNLHKLVDTQEMMTNDRVNIVVFVPFNSGITSVDEIHMKFDWPNSYSTCIEYAKETLKQFDNQDEDSEYAGDYTDILIEAAREMTRARKQYTKDKLIDEIKSLYNNKHIIFISGPYKGDVSSTPVIIEDDSEFVFMDSNQTIRVRTNTGTFTLFINGEWADVVNNEDEYYLADGNDLDAAHETLKEAERLFEKVGKRLRYGIYDIKND